MKIFSVEMRLKFLAHFYTCNCRKHCVSELVSKFGTSQANISRHLIMMEELGILKHTCEKKTRYYWLNEDFKKNWKDVISPIISKEEMKKYYCCCSQDKSSTNKKVCTR